MYNKPSNHLDEAIKHLKDALKQIEQDERKLRRARKRIEKALQAFEGSNPTTKRTRTSRGPRNYASRDMVYEKIADMPRTPFGINTLAPQLPDLREGQIKGALVSLTNMGLIVREKRGIYRLQSEE